MNSLEMIECEQFSKVAFQTMKERCQQLQVKLFQVEEENLSLRLKLDKINSLNHTIINSEHESAENLQDTVNKLKAHKSILLNHAKMVALENCQLWERLMGLCKSNHHLEAEITNSEDLSNKVPLDIKYSCIETSPCLKEGKEDSLEEIPLKFSTFNNAQDLESRQRYSLANFGNIKSNLMNIGYTYPEELKTDSQEFKQHEAKLSQWKDALLKMQVTVKNTITKYQKIRTVDIHCKSGKSDSVNTGFKENEETQTSVRNENLEMDNKNQEDILDEQVCPICGEIFKLAAFELFHNHVIGHFSKNLHDDSFEMIT